MRLNYITRVSTNAMRKQNYITMVSSSGHELIKLYIHVQAPHYNMVIYIEVMSTGRGHVIITNTGIMFIGLEHNVISDVGTMFTGLGHIIISDITHVQTKHYVQY